MSTEHVPSAPCADGLNERIAYWEYRLAYGAVSDWPATRTAQTNACQRVCDEIGWTGGTKDSAKRRLYRMRRQLSESNRGTLHGVKGPRSVTHTDWFLRTVVEEALFHAGVPFHELYPEIAAAEELELEPDAWCPHCRESRSPINGQCPFCEWRLGPPTGQVLMGSRRWVA